MSNTAPTISVLLPVYNSERYVRWAVQSILIQTFADFELLVIDDGSTDRSLSILRELAANDGRMRVESRENKGIVATLNELIRLARGSYLARMDSDDISRPERFEKQLAYLAAHPECVAVGTGILWVDPEGMPIFDLVNELAHDRIDAGHMSGIGGGIWHPSVMMRKEAVLRIGAYRAEYQLAEDMDLFLRLAEVGKLANLREILLEYRQHVASLGYIFQEKQYDAARRVVQAAHLRRGMDCAADLAGKGIRVEAPADTHRKWAWWALSAGNIATARKHALKAFAARPLKAENLRVLACAIRGH
jgi:glycosyltransferase involved in cell wall biosynthesis